MRSRLLCASDLVSRIEMMDWKHWERMLLVAALVFLLVFWIGLFIWAFVTLR